MIAFLLCYSQYHTELHLSSLTPAKYWCLQWGIPVDLNITNMCKHSRLISFLSTTNFQRAASVSKLLLSPQSLLYFLITAYVNSHKPTCTENPTEIFWYYCIPPLPQNPWQQVRFCLLKGTAIFIPVAKGFPNSTCIVMSLKCITSHDSPERCPNSALKRLWEKLKK